MRTMKQIIIFTHCYPFGNADTFLRDELPFLKEGFDAVHIQPLIFAKSSRKEIEVNGCIVHQPILQNKNIFSFFFKSIFNTGPTNHFFSRELLTADFKKLLAFFRQALLLRLVTSSSSFKEIRKIHFDVAYFYWGTNLAYAAPFIKANKRVARFHGYDLYESDILPKNYLPMRNQLFQSLDKIITISQFGSNYLKKKYPGFSEKIIQQRLGTKDYGPPPSTPPSLPIIVSCSSLIELKRVEEIAMALKSVEGPLKWVHFGDGPRMTKVKEITSSFPQDKLVELHGYVPNEKVINFYKQNNVSLFINFSTSEGIPVSIMEAISFDIPVLAAKVGGVPEIVSSSSGVLVNRDCTTKELTRAISLMLQSNPLDFSPRQYWKEHFSAQKNYKEFSQLLVQGK